MTRGLIGRDAELAELEARASANRLVTVVGPGGVGKTTLARAAAERLAPRFPLGVRHVDLTRVDDATAVPGTLAAQLGFDSFEALLASPTDRPVLLIVDNCEHLLDAVAGGLVQLLGACHQPTVVATSRAPLEVPGESLISLAPLGVPDMSPGSQADPSTSASVQLFLERCLDAAVEVGPSDMPAVVELCRRLDGLPLAIEIAAARSRTMSIAEIADRLQGSVEVLDRPRFRGDPRHRGVAHTIRWSFDLLPPHQAELLAALAVFVGPFTADHARAIARTDDHTLADLDDLVNVSLVAADTTGPTTRYRLLDTVRRFARAELEARDEYVAAHDRFVDHVLANIASIVAGGTASWRPTVARDLDRLYDDIAEALRWCVAHDAEPNRAYRLCSVLWGVVHQGRADEIAGLIWRTLDRWPEDGSSLAAQASAVLATADYVTGHPELAAERATGTLAQLQRPGIAAVTLHRALGQARRALGDTAGAVAAFDAGAEIGHRLGMTAMALELDIAAAVVTADAGDVDTAVAALERVLEQAESIDSPLTGCWAGLVLGWVLLRRGPDAAHDQIVASLASARALDYSIGVSVGLRSQVFESLLRGNVRRAVADVTELLHDLIGRGALSNARLLVDAAAAVAYRCGHPAWEALAATARALPITTLVCAHFELVPLPATSVPPRPRVESLGLAWQVIAELADEADHAAVDGEGAPAAAGPQAAAIRRLGDMCEFTYAGRVTTLRAGKGVADVIRLIESAGREVHCLDLAGAAVQESSTGDVIDSAARRDYEQRIRDLQTELEEAEANNDYGRAYKCQAELDALIDHLTAALGKGRRTRRGTDSAERARSAVTHRIRTTIRQIERIHPVLARHLAHSVSTGVYCCYQPEHPTTWTID